MVAVQIEIAAAAVVLLRIAVAAQEERNLAALWILEEMTTEHSQALKLPQSSSSSLSSPPLSVAVFVVVRADSAERGDRID